MTNIARILVPLDIHEDANYIKQVEFSVELAQQHNAKLIFVNVVDIDLDSTMLDRYKDVKANYTSMAKQQLLQIIDNKIPEEIETDFKVLSGRSYSKIIAVAEETDADFIIIAAHKPGMADFFTRHDGGARGASCDLLGTGHSLADTEIYPTGTLTPTLNLSNQDTRPRHLQV